MKELSIRPHVIFATLPAWSADYKGALAYQTSDNKLYYATDSAWAAIGTGGSPGGNSGELQYNFAGTFAGAANAEIHDGDLILASNAAPSVPPSGYIKLYSRLLAGTSSRRLPSIVDPQGIDIVLQPALWNRKIARWNALGNSTTAPGLDGFAALSTIGTLTLRNVATTNLFTRTRRFGYVSAATAGSLAGQYSTAAQFTVGNGAGAGGFFYSCRFGMSSAAALATGRKFVGLSSSVALPTNVEPNTLTNSIGVAKLSTSNNLHIVYGGSVAQTAIDLGANFPADSLSADLYDLTLFSAPSANGVVYYQVMRIGTTFAAAGALGPGTPGTTLPSATTFLAHRAWVCNNAVAQAVGIDVVNIYIETDY